MVMGHASLSLNNSEIPVFISGTLVISGGAGTPLSVSGAYNGSRNFTHFSNDFPNYGAQGLIVITDVTAISGTPAIQMELQGKDSVSGKYYHLISGAYILGTTTQRMSIYPSYPSGGTAYGGEERRVAALPRTWRINFIHSGSGGANAATYTTVAIPII